MIGWEGGIMGGINRNSKTANYTFEQDHALAKPHKTLGPKHSF